ncbi:MAG: helix-turn-helix domain-containing protein [Planctomycetia bacterium]|nr:helix-turn-helix domain-containing protein [Planctomycetia bacterium]
MKDANNEILDLDQLCSYVNLSKSTVYKLLQTGRFPGVKIGRLWRFKRDLVDRWLLTQTNLTDAEALEEEYDFNANAALDSPVFEMAAKSREIRGRAKAQSDREYLEQIFTNQQIKRLATHGLDNPMALVGQFVTNRGKARVRQLLNLSEQEAEELASSLSNYINNQI